MTADGPVPVPAERRIRALARLSEETAGGARALLGSFRGPPGDAANTRLSTYERFTCAGALSAAVRHLEYAERIFGRHARAAGGRPSRLTWGATDDPRRLDLVASAAEGGNPNLHVGQAELIRQDDGADQWRARLTDAGDCRGSRGDYESWDGLLEALERQVAEDGPWWTEPQP